MPIGVVRDEDFQAELERLSGSRERASVVDAPQKGRTSNDPATPESLRKIIGEESVINGRQAALKLAADFGISESSVSAYAKGATSTASYSKPVKGIIEHINKSRQRATKKASHVLTSALAAITQEKLDYTDAKDLSSIAKDMSVVIKNLEPPAESASQGSVSSSPQFIIYAPQFRKEESFDVIDVRTQEG